MMKIIMLFDEVYQIDNKEQTIIIMTYIQICLLLDNKSDLDYTRIL